MESRQNLAENLKKYRLRQNMKMDEFADYLGIGRTSLYELENMRVSCTLDTLDGIASHMGVPASMLLVKDMDPTQTPACAHIVDLCSCYMKLPMDQARELAEHILRMGDILSSARGEEGASHE